MILSIVLELSFNTVEKDANRGVAISSGPISLTSSILVSQTLKDTGPITAPQSSYHKTLRHGSDYRTHRRQPSQHCAVSCRGPV